MDRCPSKLSTITYTAVAIYAAQSIDILKIDIRHRYMARRSTPTSVALLHSNVANLDYGREALDWSVILVWVYLCCSQLNACAVCW
jgi:hypothetical protein